MVMSCKILLSPTLDGHGACVTLSRQWSMDSGDSLKIWIVGLFTMKRMIGSWRLESSVIHCHLCILFNMYIWRFLMPYISWYVLALFQQLMLALFSLNPGHHGRFQSGRGMSAVLWLTCRGFARKIIGFKNDSFLLIQCHTNENRSSKEATAAICQNTWNSSIFFGSFHMERCILVQKIILLTTENSHEILRKVCPPAVGVAMGLLGPPPTWGEFHPPRADLFLNIAHDSHSGCHWEYMPQKNRSPRKLKTGLILRTTSMISTSSISEYLLVLLTDCWCRLWPQGWKSLKPQKCADQTNMYRSAWPSSYNVGSWYIESIL